MTEDERLKRKVIDTDRVNVHLSGGVNKVRVPAKFRRMRMLKQFFEGELEMLVVTENGLPYLEIRRAEP